MGNFIQLLEKYLTGKINPKEMIELSDQLIDEQDNEIEKILFTDWGTQFESEGNRYRKLQPLLNEVHQLIRLNENKVQESAEDTLL